MTTQDAINLLRMQMDKHNLYSWVAKLDNAKRRFGQCNFTKKTISISKPLCELNNKEVVLDTILHEIAHALVGIRNGHNEVWKHTAKTIGCNGERLYKLSEVKTPPKKYMATCPNCNHVFQSHINTRCACASCCNKYANGSFDKKYLLTFKENTIDNL